MMKFSSKRILLAVCAVGGLALWVAGGVDAQTSGGGANGASGASTSATQPGRDTSPLNAENSLDLLPHPADKKEEKAFNVFKATPDIDPAKKVQAAETFLKAYPKSQLAQLVYPYLVVGYIQMGQVDKGVAAAQQDFAANPKDYRTMAVLSQTLARTFNPSAPNAEEQLTKADEYGKKALDGVATLKKPEGMADDAFAKVKAETEGMARSGVGLVALRNGKFDEAILELEKATALNAGDQTNFYLLGVANANSKRYADAAAAFAKCAALPGNLQANCTSAAADAKKNAGQ